jgi:hypothetical protein
VSCSEVKLFSNDRSSDFAAGTGAWDPTTSFASFLTSLDLMVEGGAPMDDVFTGCTAGALGVGVDATGGGQIEGPDFAEGADERLEIGGALAGAGRECSVLVLFTCGM